MTFSRPSSNTSRSICLYWLLAMAFYVLKCFAHIHMICGWYVLQVGSDGVNRCLEMLCGHSGHYIQWSPVATSLAEALDCPAGYLKHEILTGVLCVEAMYLCHSILLSVLRVTGALISKRYQKAIMPTSQPPGLLKQKLLEYHFRYGYTVSQH